MQLHFSESLDIGHGGPATSVPSLGRILSKYDTLYVSLDSQSATNELISEENWLRLKTSSWLVTYWKLFICLKRADTVHWHTIWSPSIILLFCVRLLRPRLRTIFYARGSLIANSFKKLIFQYLLLYPSLFLFDRIVCATQGQIVEELPLVFQNKVIVMPNPIADFMFSETIGFSKMRVEERNRIVFVGRVSRHKRIEEAVKICLMLGHKKIIVAGRCDDYEYLSELLQYSVSIGVKFDYMGVLNKKQLVNLYLSSAVLILTSKSENFGNVLLEAARYGVVPLVSSNLYISEYLDSRCVVNLDSDRTELCEKVYDGLANREFVIEAFVNKVSVQTKTGLRKISEALNS